MNSASEKRLAKVHPLLAEKVRALASNLTVFSIHIEVVQGLRTFAEQDALFAQGRSKPGSIVTNAKGGQSNHNYGLACDVCPFVNGQPQWEDNAAFKKIGAVATGLGLDWGGNWKRFVDMPHVQLPGMTIKECSEIYKRDGLDAVWAEATKRAKKTPEPAGEHSETAAEARATAGENAPEPVVEQPKDPPPKEINAQTATTVNASKPSILGQISSITIPAGLTTAIATIGKLFMGIPPWAWALIIAVGIIAAAYLWNEKRKRAHERTLKIADIAADPQSNNVYLGGGENK